MSRISVAVIHYHLQPGGVTRVIERAIESLGDSVDVAIFSGETFPALGYSDSPPDDIEKQADGLRRLATERLGREPDIWHIHNHSLGKNSFTPRLVQHLARAGCRLLLQPHDFAEDGRPENYRLLKDQLGDELNDTLYPLAEHVWYAPINYRDKAFLEEIGLPHVHELPNAVTPHPAPESPISPPASLEGTEFTETLPLYSSVVKRESARTIVYPARAIRRKNMGEFLLWSLLAPEGYLFQSTLEPQNPVWLDYYNEWVEFAQEQSLPVEFNAGRKHDFGELVQNAEALISTSIAEGFGLAFLEPWLERKMLVGRKLPEITSDFETEGLDLSPLYDALPVPLKWAGEAQFFQTLEAAMRKSYESYAREWDPALFEQAIGALAVDGKVDFGILDESLQRNVIRHLVEHPEDRNQFPPFPVRLRHGEGGSPPPSLPLIEHNLQVVLDRYGLAAYGERLVDIYQKLAATEPGAVKSANAAGLLDQFLQPNRFNLLRT